MTITIDMPAEKAAKLAEAARTEGVEVETLLSRLADDYLERNGSVAAAAKYVLAKNAELYRRLAK